MSEIPAKVRLPGNCETAFASGPSARPCGLPSSARAFLAAYMTEFRTYVGIKRSRKRLRNLLARYESRPMVDAAEDLALRVLPTFRLGEPVEVAARAAA